MARITTYAIDSAISGKDKLVGSDAEDSNITKNYLIADLANYIGTSNTGAQGPAGPAGPTGTPGANGSNGSNGNNGAPGAPGSNGAQGAAGADGTSISILGAVANCAALPTTGNTTGDLYILDADDAGCSGIAGDGFVWTAGSAWLNIGPLRGPQGIQGPDGTDGSDGEAGAAGADGSNGAPGAAGAQGPQGIQGSLSSSEALSLVGLDLSWSNRDPLYAVNSTYITNLVYSRLGVDFNNLDFEAGSIYKLILERKRKASVRDAGGNFRKGGYKRSTGYGMQLPYSNRLSEIVFNEATGAKFDFGWDLFFQQGAQFPRPSGISTTTSGITPASADIHFALRISKQTGNITEVSPVLTEFTLRGIFNPNQTGADKQKRLTFILK